MEATRGALSTHEKCVSFGSNSTAIDAGGSSVSKLGSVSKVEMTPLHCPSKGIAVDKQANDEVVHLYGFREANGLTDQAFNTRPQG